MTLAPSALLTILLMALTTYATRMLGYLALGDRVLSPRTKAVLDAAPACVLLAVISPAFVTPSAADLAALAITVIAAARFSLTTTVVVAVASSAMLRTMSG